ncbi:MAG: carbohydrate kinase family protein [Theionarchaea archaeon]|nr:carbohydrate kinase family protein [Theionarchaea archaeon]
MTEINDSLRKFWKFCQQKRLDQAAIRAIPYIGPSICDIVYGGTEKDLKNLIEVLNLTIEQQNEIISKLESVMKPPLECILVIGSGYVEYLLELHGDFELGRKHVVTCHEFIGGSGINHTLRLIHAGFPALPILSIGKDQLGQNIREKILISAKRAGISQQVLTFIDSEEFFAANIRTPLSAIVVGNVRKTNFSSQIYGSTYFLDHVRSRLEYLDAQPNIDIKAIIIGHIHADSPDLIPSHMGECTKHIIDSFSGKRFLFGNFGDSQICMGVDFWEEHLRKLSVFQLNLNEMRRFFGPDGSKKSLVDIVHWFRDKRITAVITLDKFGAVGIHKDGQNRVILAWPFELEDYVDSTGAGDAFGAGLTSKLYQKGNFSFGEFLSAIEEARVWAAYACTTLGGATLCPDQPSLREFHQHVLVQPHPIEVQQMEHAERILQILDKAYQ